VDVYLGPVWNRCHPYCAAVLRFDCGLLCLCSPGALVAGRSASPISAVSLFGFFSPAALARAVNGNSLNAGRHVLAVLSRDRGRRARSAPQRLEHSAIIVFMGLQQYARLLAFVRVVFDADEMEPSLVEEPEQSQRGH